MTIASARHLGFTQIDVTPAPLSETFLITLLTAKGAQYEVLRHKDEVAEWRGKITVAGTILPAFDVNSTPAAKWAKSLQELLRAVMRDAMVVNHLATIDLLQINVVLQLEAQLKFQESPLNLKLRISSLELDLEREKSCDKVKDGKLTQAIQVKNANAIQAMRIKVGEGNATCSFWRWWGCNG